MSEEPTTTTAQALVKPKRQRVLTQRQQDRRDNNPTSLSTTTALLNQYQTDEDNQFCFLGPQGTGDDDNAGLPPIPQKFKYGDHTADIILHGYGSTPEESIESVTYGMLSYMFDYPGRTKVNPLLTHNITVYGQDIPDLIFRFLTEILGQGVNYYDDLSADLRAKFPANLPYPGMVPRIVEVVSLSEELPPATVTLTSNIPTAGAATTNTTTTASEFDLNIPKTPGKVFKLVVKIMGDWLDVVKLGAGTEVKAITNELTRLQILTNPAEAKENGGKYHLQVLVDI